MNELGMQQLIVDDVNRRGGFARKMSHRFNVGVVDLLVKERNFPAGVLEVKQRDMPKDEGLKWQLDLTGPQERYLRDAMAAGMPAGVASFTHRRGSGPLIGGRGRLRLLVLTYTDYNRRGGVVEAHEHELIGDGPDAPWSIEEHMAAWLGRWARGKLK